MSVVACRACHILEIATGCGQMLTLVEPFHHTVYHSHCTMKALLRCMEETSDCDNALHRGLHSGLQQGLHLVGWVLRTHCARCITFISHYRDSVR
jgi:hypothetical protein